MKRICFNIPELLDAELSTLLGWGNKDRFLLRLVEKTMLEYRRQRDSGDERGARAKLFDILHAND